MDLAGPAAAAVEEEDGGTCELRPARRREGGWSKMERDYIYNGSKPEPSASEDVFWAGGLVGPAKTFIIPIHEWSNLNE